MSESDKLKFYSDTLSARLLNPGGLSECSCRTITERFSNSINNRNVEKLFFNYIQSFGSEDAQAICETVREKLENLNSNDVLNKQLGKRIQKHNSLVAKMAIEVDGKDYPAGDIGMIKSPLNAKLIQSFGTFKGRQIQLDVTYKI